MASELRIKIELPSELQTSGIFWQGLTEAIVKEMSLCSDLNLHLVLVGCVETDKVFPFTHMPLNTVTAWIKTDRSNETKSLMNSMKSVIVKFLKDENTAIQYITICQKRTQNPKL